MYVLCPISGSPLIHTSGWNRLGRFCIISRKSPVNRSLSICDQDEVEHVEMLPDAPRDGLHLGREPRAVADLDQPVPGHPQQLVEELQAAALVRTLARLADHVFV